MPRVKMTPVRRAVLYSLRVYLLLLVGLLVLRFAHVLG